MCKFVHKWGPQEGGGGAGSMNAGTEWPGGLGSLLWGGWGGKWRELQEQLEAKTEGGTE